MTAYLKFGVHGAGVGGNYTGLDGYIATCSAAGVPCIVQAVDNTGPCVAVQELGRPFDVIVFRMTGRDGVNLDQTNYNADPVLFARKRMMDIAEHWPPELNRSKVWTVPVNEPSKEPGDIDWLAAFTLECANISLDNGWKHLAYGWSTGTPEPEFWLLPQTLDYLRLCNQHKDLLGVSLHEYSLTDNLQSSYPWLIGRFKFLHESCDAHDIPHPTIIMGEFGWREASIRPTPGTFTSQLDWAQSVYSPHDNILGAAIWTLGFWHGTVADDLASNMPTLSAMAAEFPPYEEIPPVTKHKAIVVKLPQDMTSTEWSNVANTVYNLRHTMTASHDDMMGILRGGNEESYVKFSHPTRDAAAVALVEAAGYRWEPLYQPMPEPFRFTHWPTISKVVTQKWAANPADYLPFGLPGHEGIDMRAVSGSPIYAVADGKVSAINPTETGHNYGIFVRVAHKESWETTYAHLQRTAVNLGQTVAGGDIIGYADSTGNSTGSHLHLTLKRLGYTFTDQYGTWPYNIFDPTPFVSPFNPSWPSAPPPVGIDVDIRPYFEPAATVGQFTVFAWLDGSKTQNQQLQRLADGTIALVKGNDYERWRFAGNEMQRAEDTSMGGGLAYTQNWARWLPQVVRVGATYSNSPRVVVKRRSDCVTTADNVTTDYLTVAALHLSWRSPYGLSFENVLEIHWRKSSGGAIQEKYFIAPGLAYVAWGVGDVEAAVSELPQGRPALPWSSWGCG